MSNITQSFNRTSPLITSCWEAFVKSASAVWFYCPSSAQVSWLYGRLPHLHWAFSVCAFALATSAALSLNFVISVPLFRLPTHCFHVLQLSFSILTCLAHFSVTLKWIPISPSLCSRLTHRTQFFCITCTPTLIISIATFPLALHLSVARLMKFFVTPSSQILSSVMLEVFSEDFPEFFTAEVQMVWTKLMGAVYWHVTGAYTEVGWLQVSSSAVWRVGKKRW